MSARTVTAAVLRVCTCCHMPFTPIRPRQRRCDTCRDLGRHTHRVGQRVHRGGTHNPR